MKTTKIVGFKREELGTKYSKRLRADGNVPSVLYGGEEVIHFSAPVYLYKDLIYTPDPYIVELNVEGTHKRCVIKDAQFHPVSDTLLHVDFLEIFDDKKVTLEVPVKIKGTSPGVAAGGQVYIKTKKLKVTAIPSKLPDFIEVDISTLELGSAVRVGDLPESDLKIETKTSVSVVQIIVPRALKAAGDDVAGEVAEGEEGAEGAEDAAE